MIPIYVPFDARPSKEACFFFFLALKLGDRRAREEQKKKHATDAQRFLGAENEKVRVTTPVINGGKGANTYLRSAA